MAADSVEIIVSARDQSQSTFDRIKARLDDLSKKVATAQVDLNTNPLERARLDALKKLQTLADRTVTASADLNDKQLNVAYAEISAKLDRLSKRVASPRVSMEGVDRTLLDIAKVDLALDRLDKKRPAVHVSLLSRLRSSAGAFAGRLGGLYAGGGGIGGFAGRLGGLFSAGGAAAGAVGQAAGGAGQAAGGAAAAGGPYAQAGQAALFGAGSVAAAALAPAAIPTLLGGGLGILGAYLTMGKQLTKTFGGILATVKSALAPLKPLFVSVFSGLNAFTKTLGPALRDVFAYSVPYLKTFVTFMEQATKALLPAFSRILREMVPFLPMLTKGLMNVVQGLVSMLNAIGPRGMLDSMKLFIGLTRLAELALKVLGPVINATAVFFVWLGNKIIQRVNDWRKTFDDFRHRTAVVFDGIRHDIAHYWDLIWNNTIGRLNNGLQQWNRLTSGWQHDIAHWYDTARHDIAHWWDLIWNNTVGRLRSGVADWDRLTAGWWHDIAHWFDVARHDIASAWDTIWNNTVGRVKRGISDVVSFFHGLPGKVANALLGLGSKLWSLGKTWLSDMYHGILSVWDSVLHWFEGLPSRILHALGIHSPPDWAIDAGKHVMHGIAHGLGLGVGDVLKFVSGLPGKIGGMAAHALLNGVEPPGAIARFGNPSGSVQDYAKNLLNAYGWGGQWGAFNDIVMRESGWQVNATNPSSGAYGIPQALPGSKMASAGSDWRTDPYTQLRWMMAYIKSRWGDPNRADYNERTQHWYGSGLSGGIFTRPTLIGVGERGAERVDVTPIGKAGPQIVIQLAGTGSGDLDKALLNWIQKTVRVKGGGDVQIAFGRS